MAANQYSTMVSRLATELAALTDYTGLVVSTGIFRPAALPAFTRYAIVVAPNARPWEERLTAVREIQYLFRVDLYLLVKNYHASNALFGTTAPDLGLFQFIEDTKLLLRRNTLTGLLDKTYTEPGGDINAGGAGGIDFEEVAAVGFESAEYTFVHRARIPFLGRMKPFCFDVASPL